jgi:hypothetical protein
LSTCTGGGAVSTRCVDFLLRRAICGHRLGSADKFLAIYNAKLAGIAMRAS